MRRLYGEGIRYTHRVLKEWWNSLWPDTRKLYRDLFYTVVLGGSAMLVLSWIIWR